VRFAADAFKPIGDSEVNMNLEELVPERYRIYFNQTNNLFKIMDTWHPSIKNLKLEDNINNSSIKVLNDNLKLNDTYTRIWTLARTYSDNLILNDGETNNFTRLLSDTLKLTANLTKMPGKKLSEDLILNDGDITDIILKLITESFKLNAQVTKDTTRKLIDNLKLFDLLNKKPSRIISDSLKLNSSILFIPNKNLNDSLKLTDNYSRIWHSVKTYQDYLVLGDGEYNNIETILIETLKLTSALIRGKIFQEYLVLNDEYIRLALSQNLMLLASGSYGTMLMAKST
jgi:hypothetical protein